ncbi:DMT family transporter [Rothia nasisuis]|uniref:DMT family transporter n=1 Tax=Rothia nasisuis TaxID=2109647 RepID=UPI001F3ED1FD|nr:DMT family transporter [Rothia nasisuis]
MRRDSTLLHISAVAGAALLWSTSFAVTKVVLPSVGELMLGAIRFLAAAILLIIICLLTRAHLRAPWIAHISVASAGLVGITIYFALENYGVALATATDAVLIVASYPVMTMLAEAVFQHRRPTLTNVFGALIAFIGVLLVTIDEPTQEAPHRPWGILFLFLGGVAWTAYNMLSAQSPVNLSPNQRLGVLSTTALQNLWGGIGFCLLVPFLPEGTTTSLNTPAIWLIAYLAVGCSALAFLLYTYGLTALKPSQAVAILNLVPVFGVIWAVVIAGEEITVLKAIGAMTVIIGVAMNARSSPTRIRKQQHQSVTAPSRKDSQL